MLMPGNRQADLFMGRISNTRIAVYRQSSITRIIVSELIIVVTQAGAVLAHALGVSLNVAVARNNLPG